jgi:hypothetical protein
MDSEFQSDQDIVRLFQSFDRGAAFVPGFKERVMEEIRNTPAPWAVRHSGTKGGRRGYWWNRAAIYGMAACVTVLAVVLWSFNRGEGDRQNLPHTTAASVASKLVRFVIVAPTAKEVSVAGSFNGWKVDATPLRRINAEGTWMVDVPLETGQYSYMFVINGKEWVPDLTAPSEEDSEFGQSNSVITVVAESSAL